MASIADMSKISQRINRINSHLLAIWIAVILLAFAVFTSGCAMVRQTYNEETGVYTSTGFALIKGDVGELKTGLTGTKLDDGSREVSINQDSKNATTDITPLIAEVVSAAIKASVPIP